MSISISMVTYSCAIDVKEISRATTASAGLNTWRIGFSSLINALLDDPVDNHL
jgi:hypothetical protein